MDETTMKLGLLMEAALANQKAAESSVRKLKVLTSELGTLVREEVDRVLREDLQAMAGEARRASEALQGVKRAANLRLALWSIAITTVCSAIPLGLALWTIPSTSEIAALRARRDALSSDIRRLEEQGARIDLRRCGDGGRLCVRVDRKAPAYGLQSDYLVVRGY